MPAHTSEGEVGVKLRGDGLPVTALDRLGNALADNQAKLAAGRFAVQQQVVDLLSDSFCQSLAAMQWLGRVSWLATHNGKRLARDSEASRLAAGVVKRGRATQQQPVTGRGGRPSCPPVMPSRAATHRAARWCLRATRVEAAATTHAPGRGQHRSHHLMRSGDTFWCLRCGAYAALRGAGLAAPCTGPAPRAAAGGRSQQLRFLKRGRHPKTGLRMAPSAPWSVGDAPTHTSARNPHERGDEDALSKSREGRRRLRVRAREALRLSAPRADGESASAPAPPPATTPTPAHRGLTAASKRELVDRLIAAATFGGPLPALGGGFGQVGAPSGAPPAAAPFGALPANNKRKPAWRPSALAVRSAKRGHVSPTLAPAGAGAAPSGDLPLGPPGASPSIPPAPRLSHATLRLLALPLPVPPPSPASQAVLRRRQAHPALRKSTLPLHHAHRRTLLGASSPSHEEATIRPGDALDQCFREAEAAARAAARHCLSGAAPAQLSWRTLSLRRVAPSGPLEGDGAAAVQFPSRHELVDARFPPLPADAAWPTAHSRASKRALTHDPDVPPFDRLVRHRPS